MSAAFQGNLQVVEYLVENGADLNLTDDSGETALIAVLPKIFFLICLINKL